MPNPNPPTAAARPGGRRRALLRQELVSPHLNVVSTAPLTGGAVVVSRLARPCSSSPMASSAAPTSRSRRSCSAPPRPPCSSCRSSRSPRAGRGRGWSTCRERRAVPDPARGRGRCSARSASPPSPSPSTPGLAGTDSQQDNLAPTAVYVGFWVGVPFLSLLLGDWFRLFSPWRAIGRADRLGRRAGCRAGRRRSRCPYPERLGHWPAAAGILAFVICELCWATGREPGPLGGADARSTSFVQLVGHGRLRRRGVDAPRRRVRRLVRAVRAARAARPRARTGALVLRPPVAGATRLRAGRRHRRAARDRDRLDRLRRRQGGPAVQRRARRTCRTSSPRSGATLGVGLELAFVVGLLVAIALVGALWWLGTTGMPRAGTRPGPARAQPALRPHADPDRRRLRRRALLLAARLQRPGPVAARLRPARRRLGPVRRRRRPRSTTRS